MNNNKIKSACMEVIGVRLFHPKQNRAVVSMFTDIVSGLEQNPENIVGASLYGSANVETDWAIHLYRNAGENHPEKTGIGIHLAKALSSFGLVNHSVWCACKNPTRVS